MKENKSKLMYGFMDGEEMELTDMIKTEKDEEPSLVKSIINTVKSNDIQRLAFETDPAVNNAYQALYIAKTRLIPDSVLKRVAIQDELVATIVRARQQHIASFGRPRPDRFSLGYVIEPNAGVLNEMSTEERHGLAQQVRDVVRRIWHCGSVEGWRNEKQMSFAQCLSLLARSAVVTGRAAIERIFTYDEYGVRKFHSFRPIDGGTIYKATPQKEAAESVRTQARLLLQQLNSSKLIPEKFNNDEYAWVQLIDGRPFQAFTSEECAVYNFYPAPDVELGGYPVTPIDTTISAIATHINITTHNKLYFQNGRATKGMLVIKSDDANPQVVHNIKQFFNASINNVNSSWRMPVFGCGTNEEIGFQQIETSTRDMEFQYLTDMNARVIMGAFMISPDELPGWGFLSKGTGSQALSESNNQYQLESARDTGMRPLLFAMEDFFNTEIFPYIDQDLAKKCRLRFVGLDSDNAEKEAVRLQQDQALHLSYDDILERVEKRPVGPDFGGALPLNQAYKAYLDQYFTVGEILEKFCGREGASKDPELNYRRDPFFFQWVQFQQQKQMMEQQQQQAQQQMQMAQQQGGQGGGNNQPPPDQKAPTKGGDPQAQDYSSESAGQKQSTEGDQLARSIDQAVGILNKSEKNLSPSKRKLLAAQKKTVDTFLKGWEEDLQEAQKEIVKVAEHLKPKK